MSFSANTELRDVQLDFAMLRGRYEEMSKSQKDLEVLATEEQGP